ncbi:type IV secretion system protein [Sphingomonas sp. SRS2]|uniref:type IV secretion system protein n=1 Tax=Sphingomonas sp. SRS2 TaxID=133190 RepID=UPI000A015E37|nr:type IV secretion system protein [Sphingomonas sp. SRS2]
MLNLREYRDRTDRLADHLPWAALVAPGVVLNKDGSFQRSFAFRGPDLESATEGELVAACARANNVLRRFGSGWALFFEAARTEAIGYPTSSFPDPISHLVDLERRADFEAAGQHFESRYHMTLLWLPPADAAETVGRTLIDRPDAEETRDWRAALQRFVDETDRALDLFSGFMPEVCALSDAETLTYLHDTISLRRQPIAVPEVPMYLDAVLADTPLLGGLEPKLGDEHLRTITILGFPPLSRPAILDALNHQNFAYRWVSRFLPLDKVEASKALTSLRRQWFNKRKSITALLREVLYNQPAQLLDSDADNKVIDADQALQALGGDLVSFGYLTVTVTVSDRDRNAVEEKVRSVERIVNGLGFSTIKEGVNAIEAWLSSIPGNPYANVRQPLVHTLNIAHLMPLAGVWAGPAADSHLDGPPLLTVQTAGFTPFRLSAHVGDVGHMIVVGPTGAGKSVLLALMALQFRRYPDAQIYIFDKGYSSRAAVLAMNGAHHSLGADSESGLAFQPLRHIDNDRERAWASEWIAALLAHEKLLVTPDIKETLWSALTSLASAPVFVTIIEFKLTSLAGFILVPFALWNRTSFLAERVLGNVVASGIKVMVLAVIVGIGSNFFSDFTSALNGREPDIGQAMSLVLAALSLFGLGIFGPSIASGLVAGAPQLGAGAAVGTVAGAVGMGYAAGSAAGAVGRGTAGGAISAIRAGTTVGTAAGQAYQMGQSVAGSASPSAGMSGVARVAGHALRERASQALGLDEARERGNDLAWAAVRSGPSARPAANDRSAGAPRWAQDMRTEQTARYHRHAALQTVREGDRGGASAAPDIKEKED